MANIFNFMQQAQQMQGKLQQLQDELARRTVSATAGAGHGHRGVRRQGHGASA